MKHNLLFFYLFGISSVLAQEIWKSSVFPDSLYERYNWQFFSLMIEEVHDSLDARNPDLGLLNAALFYATNMAREKHGLHPLTFAPALRDASCFHAQELAKYNYVGHDNPWNEPFNSLPKRSRFFESGGHSENVTSAFTINYQSNRYFYRIPHGESYDYFYTDDTPIYGHTYWTFAKQAIENFLNSPPHKRNMLSFYHRTLGCGVAVEPWHRVKLIPMGFGVQNFGR